MPQIAHLPVILNPSGKGKLSKRSAGFTEGGRKVPVLLYEFQDGGLCAGSDCQLPDQYRVELWR